MSMIAFITVNACDKCGRIEALQTREQYAAFESTWYCGWSKHFCVQCRESAEAVQAIRDHEAQQRAIDRVIRKYAADAPRN